MTEPQLRAKIEYCTLMRDKHTRLEFYFDSKLTDLQADLFRMRNGLYVKRGPFCRIPKFM